jgi:LPPG:FO 2-phospho-L-lactate transferase
MIVVLTGGTGGAKLVEGLAAEIDSAELRIICNTGDDSVFHGLYVSPDIDTIIYTLAGMIDHDRGWGIKGDTFVALAQLRRLGDDLWFNIGDKDLATHITRTRLLGEGRTLSEITDHLRRTFGVRATILAMSNERVETRIMTPMGELSFQEYFVKHRWSFDATAVRFAGAERSRPAPGVINAIHEAEAIIVCPSNPITSLGPILAVPGIRSALKETKAAVIGVSPIIGESAIAGPAHRLMIASAFEASAFGVARCYGDFLDTLFIADEDRASRQSIERLNIAVVPTEIRIASLVAKRRLARQLLDSLGK